ncbi:MAG: RNA methyltransferase [Bilophila wadsworthia]
MTPEQAAGEIAPLLHEGSRVAIVFGCEDRGLSNADIEQCQRLVTIPTAGEASSLNLAQAILILTYECMKAVSRVDSQPSLGNDPGQQSRRITHEEQALLYARLKETLLAIDYLKSDNPDYFLMPLRRFLGKSGLRRHEMDMLMGICRQVVDPGRRRENRDRPPGAGPRPCPWANSSTQPPAAKAKGICTGSSQSVPTCPRRHPSGRTAGSSFFRTDAG